MIHVDPISATSVARDAQAAFRSYDHALRTAASLTISFLDTMANVGGEGVTAKESQRVLATFHKSQGDLVAARGGMADATVLMTSLQRRSNIAETSFGCPGSNNPLDHAEEAKPLRVVA